MSFKDKVKDAMGQSLQASRDFMSKAGAKAQDLGEKGVLKLEIVQLKGQVQKLLGTLGHEVYASLAEKNLGTISSEDPVIKGILSEISSIKEAIDNKEKELGSSKK
jgi:hypothetical protein